MRTIIFAYKGAIGAETDIENGVFINNPKSENQLGVVISVDEIDITPEAVSILKNAKRERGSFANIMLTKHSSGESNCEASIGLYGFGKHVFMNTNLAIGKDCDTSILDMCNIIEFDIPTGFTELINLI